MDSSKLSPNMIRHRYRIGSISLLCSLQMFAIEKPNIIYILANDAYVNAGFSRGTEIINPNWGLLAAGGFILKSFYVQPVFSFARSALMTSPYPSSTGIYSVIIPHRKWGLKFEQQTLVQGLRNAGYKMAISGKWHLVEYEEIYRPTKRGFGQKYGLWFGAIDCFTHERTGLLYRHRSDQSCKDVGYSMHLLAKDACRITWKKNTDKTLFLYRSFYDVYGLFQVLETYMDGYLNSKGDCLKYVEILSAMAEATGQVLEVSNKNL